MTKVRQKTPDLTSHREKPIFPCRYLVLDAQKCTSPLSHSPPAKVWKLSSRSALISILCKRLQSYHSQAWPLPQLNSVLLFIADGELKGISPLLTLGLLSKWNSLQKAPGCWHLKIKNWEEWVLCVETRNMWEMMCRNASIDETCHKMI